jgi:hypothetical protein
MSSFSVSGTTAVFTALEPFSDKGLALEEWTFDVEVDDPTTWGAFFSLRSWNVTQRPIPGGNIVYVDIGGGAGEGSLQVDGLDPHNAVLTALTRKILEAGAQRSIASATFLITA